MIAIESDFNHLDGDGRLILADLVIHATTPFAELAQADDRMLFVDGNEFVEGRLVADEKRGWVGEADWDTQDTIRAYPSELPVLASSPV